MPICCVPWRFAHPASGNALERPDGLYDRATPPCSTRRTAEDVADRVRRRFGRDAVRPPPSRRGVPRTASSALGAQHAELDREFHCGVGAVRPVSGSGQRLFRVRGVHVLDGDLGAAHLKNWRILTKLRLHVRHATTAARHRLVPAASGRRSRAAAGQDAVRNPRPNPEPYAVDRLPPGPDGRPPRLCPLRRYHGSGTAHCSSVRSPRAMNRDHAPLKIHFRYTA